MAEKEEKIISAKRINVIVQELKGLVSEQLLTKPILQNKLDIADWALQPTKPTYDKRAVGLGNVENTAFYKRICIVNGQQYSMAGTVNTDGFSIYAPTSNGDSDGLILTSKTDAAPVWKAPSSITVGKATQLANTRKIWGQEFDGSDKVSGAMSEVTNINNTLYFNSSGNVGIGITSPTAKFHVNGTFNAQGATTLNSTLLVKDLATFEKNILLANTNTIGFKHTDGSNINLLTLTQNNEAQFGYGTIAKGLTSTLYGKKIQFKTKDSLDNDAIIDENGNFHSYHDISAAGGVSASGINDFDVEQTEKTATITSLLPSDMIPDSTGIRLLKQGGRVTIQGQFVYTYGTSTNSVKMFTIPDEFMPNTNVNASWQVASGNIMWRCGISKSTKALYLFGIINPITGDTTDTTSRTYSINFTYII